MLLQTNLVLAVASDPNNPITSAITSAIISTPSPTPQPTSTPIPSPIPTASPSPIPTPTPLPVITPVISSISSNPATLGTNITLTGSGFNNLSRVYVDDILMIPSFYVVGSNGNTLTFLLDTEINFGPASTVGNNHLVRVQNNPVTSNNVLLTIAPSLIQIIPPVAPNQVLLAPTVTLDTGHPEVVLASSNFNTTVTVPRSVDNPTVNFSNLLTTSATGRTAVLDNILTINATTSIGRVDVQIPALATISGPVNWNGIFNGPKVLSNSQANPAADSGTTTFTQAVLEVGLGDTPLTLDKAVRILIANQAGKLAGFQRGTTFTKITQSCSADTQIFADTLPNGGDCYISVGNDLVIWTKHFTKFVTYTQTVNTNNTPVNSSNILQPPPPSYNTQAPICGDTKPQSAPKLLSATASGRNQVTLTWSKALDPATYYLVAYGTKSGTLEYGNPNVGGKDTTSYVVKGLGNGKTYYFKVRAGNNCMPGEFSNEIAVDASGNNISAPATGFKAGVLSAQISSQASNEGELKFKPITSAKPLRVVAESGDSFTRFLNFILHLFRRK